MGSLNAERQRNAIAVNHNPVAPRMMPCTLLLVATLNACMPTQCPPMNPTRQLLSLNGHQLMIEVAATAPARACGLSMRDSLPRDHGMLFVFPDEQVREFWMKNTLIPLSIAFLDADGRVLEIHEMDPREPERRRKSSAPVRYALEVNLGWFRSKGIQPGDRVYIEQAVGK
jgi:uncharacterized membrane protein (UPF0127 family)